MRIGAALVTILVLACAFSACGGSNHGTPTSGGLGGSPKGCGQPTSPSSCILLTQDDLGQTYFTYGGRIERAFRNGRRIDVFTDLSDSQKGLAKNICDQVFIDSVPDGVGIDIKGPEIVLWSSDDTILATGATAGTGCTPI
jgi:hypothetical protein